MVPAHPEMPPPKKRVGSANGVGETTTFFIKVSPPPTTWVGTFAIRNGRWRKGLPDMQLKLHNWLGLVFRLFKFDKQTHSSLQWTCQAHDNRLQIGFTQKQSNPVSKSKPTGLDFIRWRKARHEESFHDNLLPTSKWERNTLPGNNAEKLPASTNSKGKEGTHYFLWDKKFCFVGNNASILVPKSTILFPSSNRSRIYIPIYITDTWEVETLRILRAQGLLKYK